MKKELLFTATTTIGLLLVGCNANANPNEQAIPSTEIETPTAAQPSEEVLEAAEVMPEFPGGMHALLGTIAQNLKYPKEAVDSQIEGRVVLQFVVDKQGKVTDIQVLHGMTPELDQAAIDVMHTLPAWQPGRQDGKPVNVKYTLPINFKLK